MKKRNKPVSNRLKHVVRTPLFKMRVQKSKKWYKRNEKHKGTDNPDSLLTF